MTTQGARAATALEHYRLQLLTKGRPHRLPLLIRTQTDNTPLPLLYTHTRTHIHKFVSDFSCSWYSSLLCGLTFFFTKCAVRSHKVSSFSSEWRCEAALTGKSSSMSYKFQLSAYVLRSEFCTFLSSLFRSACMSHKTFIPKPFSLTVERPT